MNKKRFLFKLLAILMISACSRSISPQELDEYVLDASSGLSAVFWDDGSEMILSAYPDNLPIENVGDNEIICFQLRTDNSEKLFTLSELNFRLKMGEEEKYASLAFAENRGFVEKNRLIIVFVVENISNENFTVEYLDDRGNIQQSILFQEEELKQLRKLKTRL